MQYKRCGLRNGAKDDATALPHSRPRADKVERQGFSGHMVDKRQVDTRQDIRRTQAETWQTKGKADWRRGQSGHTAGHQANARRTQRTKFGDAAIADSRRTQGRHEADTWRTQCGQALGTQPEHIAASPFFLRKNPTVNCSFLPVPSSNPPKTTECEEKIIINFPHQEAVDCYLPRPK